MSGDLAEVAREIDLVAATCREHPRQWATHYAKAWAGLTASTSDQAEVFSMCARLNRVLLTECLPSVLEMAGMIPEDESRWFWLVCVRDTLRSVLAFHDNAMRIGRLSAIDHDELRARWHPIFDGVTLAIGAPYA